MSAASLRRYADSAPVVQISGDGSLPFGNETIGLVVAAFVFHFSVPASLLAEVPRVLRAGGALVVTVYGPQTLSLAEDLRAAQMELVGKRQVVGVRGHYVFTALAAEAATDRSERRHPVVRAVRAVKGVRGGC